MWKKILCAEEYSLTWDNGDNHLGFYLFSCSHSCVKVWFSFSFADEDSNGEIDKEELKHCFQKLEISFTEEEICDLFEACDINEDMGMKFNEFIVFLCLIYLLNEPAVSEAVSFIIHIIHIVAI